MSRATPILALGLVFVFAGIALFAFALRQKNKAAGAAPKRKSDERAHGIEKKNIAKMSLAGGILAGFGALLVLVSTL